MEIAVLDFVRGLIFDCDGTLADTMGLHWQAWFEAFAAAGVTVPEVVLKRTEGMPTALVMTEFNQRYGYNVDVIAFTQDKEERARKKLTAAQPIRPVVDVVRRYRDRLPMAVASSGVLANVETILEAIGLAGYFTAIVTADDGLKPKPAPDLFLEAARRMGVSPEVCQVFEDSEAGLKAARRAGMVATDVRPYIVAVEDDHA